MRSTFAYMSACLCETMPHAGAALLRGWEFGLGTPISDHE